MFWLCHFWLPTWIFQLHTKTKVYFIWLCNISFFKWCRQLSDDHPPQKKKPNLAPYHIWKFQKTQGSFYILNYLMEHIIHICWVGIFIFISKAGNLDHLSHGKWFLQVKIISFKSKFGEKNHCLVDFNCKKKNLNQNNSFSISCKFCLITHKYI